MQVFPASHWQSYLARIGQRYVGHRVILRQHNVVLSEGNVVLWQMPLRGLFVSASQVGAEVTVQAGHTVPYIDIVLESVQEIRATFDADEGLESLRILTGDGTSILSFLTEMK